MGLGLSVGSVDDVEVKRTFGEVFVRRAFWGLGLGVGSVDGVGGTRYLSCVATVFLIYVLAFT